MQNIHFHRDGLNFQNRRVLLITPPSPFLLDQRVFVNLGILRVAASLEIKGVIVSMLDLSGISDYEKAVTDHVLDCDVEWIGITATTPQMPAAAAISKILHAVRPDLRVVLGGPHVTLTYAALRLERQKGLHGRAHRAVSMLEQMFDVLVSGDGEFAVFRVFDPTVRGLIDADVLRGEFWMTDQQYETSPWPARHLVDLDSYQYSIEGHRATSLIAQLGCPFNCGFCGGRNSRSLRVVRNRSADAVINEMRWLHETHGYTGFMFYDDELNVNPDFLEMLTAITELQQDLGQEFRLRGFVKAELFTETQAKAMYDAGFRWVLSGFESADPKILRNIDKVATLEDNTKAVKICHDTGLKVKALMSVGHPGENRESCIAVRDWLIQQQVDDFDCTVITVYPGTPYYDLAEPHPDLDEVWTYQHPKSGDRLHSRDIDHITVADYYKGDPRGGYRSYVFTDYLDSSDLVELRDQIEQQVRDALDIPWPQAASAVMYEHSMGQNNAARIFRETKSS